MNAQQQAFVQMCSAVVATCNAHTDVVSAFAPLQNALAEFEAALPNVDAALVLQNTTTEGSTGEKADMRQTATTLAVKLADILVLHGKLTGKQQLAQDAKVSYRELRNAGDRKFVGYVKTLQTLYNNQLPADITALGFTAADATALDGLLTNFTQAIGTPRHQAAESQRGTKNLEEALDALEDILEERMDPAARAMRHSQPDFYDEYTTAREIIDPSYNTLALRVKITSGQNGQPLAGVTALITPGAVQKTTGAAGMFQVDNLAPGEYSMQLSLAGHTAKTVPFAVVAGQRTDVNETLMPTAAPNEDPDS